jgi:hypothetical protein
LSVPGLVVGGQAVSFLTAHKAQVAAGLQSGGSAVAVARDLGLSRADAHVT